MDSDPSNPYQAVPQPPKKSSSGCKVALIVVACLFGLFVVIILVLAAIAVPSYLRTRSRAQATHIVSEAALYTQAQQAYATDKGAAEGTPVSFADLDPYIYTEAGPATGLDTLGNAFNITVVGTPVKVNQASYDQLYKVVTKPDFWGTYAP
jgi:type II secretory pathway pseudopilin PulG